MRSNDSEHADGDPEKQAVIRPYDPSDRSSCLRVFDSNVPQFFAPDELDLFGDFLNKLPGPAWIAQDHRHRVCGFGAVSFTHDAREAWLRWGMVERSHHGRGAGKALLLTRLDWIHTHSSAELVRVATTKSVGGFFEHMGFRLAQSTRHGIAPGVDRDDYVFGAHEVPRLFPDTLLE